MSALFKDPNQAYDYLRELNEALFEPQTKGLNHIVLLDPRFQQVPASASKHHAFDGGLVVHTAENMKVVERNCWLLKDSTGGHLNWPVVYTATLWHDYGKVWDYERNPHYMPAIPGDDRPDERKEEQKHPWRNTPHRMKIRHVSRSYAEFMKAVSQFGLHTPEFIEAVGHCILAHHGFLEWGSPVTPQTPEAWAVHLADMTSVRVFDRAITT